MANLNIMSQKKKKGDYPADNPTATPRISTNSIHTLHIHLDLPTEKFLSLIKT